MPYKVLMPQLPTMIGRINRRTKISLAQAAAIIFMVAAILSGQSFKWACALAEPSKETKKQSLYDAEIEMTGVACVGCIRRIERELRQRTGVSRCVLEFCKKGVCASVVYDPKVIQLADILKVIRSETEDYTVKSNQPQKNTIAGAAHRRLLKEQRQHK